MPTIPTGKMELELRRLYFRWLSRLGDETNMDKAVDRFEKQSIDLIEKMGGRTAMLGALADFPAPKRLDLSPHVGTIYSDMKQAAIQAGIQAGLNASDVARHMFRAGMDKSYNRLNRLARTETVSAYWKNAWDSISDLPELVMVWGAESGPRTCQWCLERDGMVMESGQLRDHPNGRCTPIPTLRSMVEYKGSVDAGGRIYQDPAWAKGSAQAVSGSKGASYRAAQFDSNELPNVFSAYDDRDEDYPEAVDFYGGAGYRDMNKALRSGGKIKRDLREMIEELNQELSRGVTQSDLQVYRGIDESGLARIFGLERDWSNGGDYDFSSLTGQTMRERGFLSTWAPGEHLNRESSFVDRADVIMQINLPAGTKGSKFPGVAGENEFLLPSDSTLVITGVEKRDGKYYVDVLLTGQG